MGWEKMRKGIEEEERKRIEDWEEDRWGEDEMRID